MLKVIFYYRFLGLGGVETALLNRMTALRSVGVESTFWFSTYYCEGAKYLSLRKDVQVVELDLSDVSSQLQEYDAIVVIDNPAIVETLTEMGAKLPVIYETHASFPPALEKFYSVLEHDIVQAIVVPSNYNRELVLASRKPTVSLTAIQNCIDTEFLESVEVGEEGALLKQEGGPIVLWIGRLEDEKNPQDFLAIANLLATSRPDIRFVMVGDTVRYESYLNGLKETSNGTFPDALEFIRKVPYEEMPALYKLTANSGGLLLSTSHFESAPMIFIEAMACQCPVLSSAVGGVAELIQDKVTGRLYPPDDVERAVTIIKELTTQELVSERQLLIQSALKNIHETHGFTSIGNRYKNLLQQLLEDKADKRDV